MKKLSYKAKSGVIIALAALSFAACTDKNDWEVDSSYNRLFSITKVSASVYATQVELTWSSNSGAEYYVIEVSTDSLYDAVLSGASNGSIVYGEDKSIKKSPYTLTDLESSTKYYLRVKSLSSTALESKWFYYTNYSFVTKSEQIIEEVTVGHTDVTLKWPSNSKVTRILILKGGSVVKVQDLTSDEITAGTATVAELDSDTDYTAQLMNETKIRGVKTFKTLMDLNGATAINPEDDVAAIFAAAENGNVYAFMTGTYEINEKIELAKSISLKSAIPGTVVINGLSFDLKAGVGIELHDLILDGAGATGPLINYLEDHKTGETGALTVSGCTIKNYAAGFINQRVSIAVKSMNITGNIFNRTGTTGRFVDIQKGYAKVINVTNNTVANSFSGDAIRIDNTAGDFTEVSSVITIDRNTFYKVCDGAAARLIYIRLSGNKTALSNNIIANSAGYYSDQSTTNITGMTNNYYVDAPNYIANKRIIDSGGTILDPQFEDAENLNFTVQNNTVINAGVGDPRWIKE